MPIPDCSYVDVDDETRPVGADFAYCLAAEVRALKGRIPYVGAVAPTGANRLWLDTNTGFWRIKFNDGDTDQWISPRGDGFGGSSGSGTGFTRTLLSTSLSNLMAVPALSVANTSGTVPDAISTYIECVETDVVPVGHRVYFPFLSGNGSSFYISATTDYVFIATPLVPSTVRIHLPNAGGTLATIAPQKWTLNFDLTKYSN